MLTDSAIQFLEDRGIDPELADRYGISSVENVKDFQKRTIIKMEYRDHGVVRYEKYRWLPKEKFMRKGDSNSIFWNVDALDDPALENGTMPLVICEGEFDALAAIQCGFPLSVSVPDGAPPAHRSADDDDTTVAPDQDGRYKFLAHSRDRLKKVKRFVLAVDGDEPGRRLREELTRLLRASRCSFIDAWPIGCKDLNDVLMKHGHAAVTSLLNTAKPTPVRGLYRLSDYPDDGELQTFSTGWPQMDAHFRLFFEEFVVVTGIPQHGKSSWCLNLLVNLASQYGIRSAIFSPEMKVVPVIRNRLCSIRYREEYSQCGPERRAWAEDNFVFIGADPNRDAVGNDDFTLEWLIDTATEAVLRDGIRVLLIDPWNEVEHAREKGESLTEYVARGIRMLKRFARERHVAVIVVAHPTKLPKRNDGSIDAPTLYDISDSSAWFNKCDHGIVVHRHFEEGFTDVSVVKSRFDEAGESGNVKMLFDRATHRFDPVMIG